MRKLILTIFIVCFITVFPENSIAVTVESVQGQINDITSQIQALDREIAQYQSQISETNGQANTLANLIKELTLTRNKLLKETQQTEKKISATNLVIGTLNESITKEQQAINRSREVLRKIFRDVNQQDGSLLLEKILSRDSIAEASREYNNLLSVNKEVNAHVDNLIEQQRALTLSKEKKENEQKNQVIKSFWLIGKRNGMLLRNHLNSMKLS